MSSVPVQQPIYPYSHPIDTQWPPATAFLRSSTRRSYWRQLPSTADSAYGSESTPAAMSSTSTMSYGHGDGHSWGLQPPFQPPARSIFYGNIGGLSKPFPGQGLGIQHHDFPRQGMNTNPATIPATTLGNSTIAPLSPSAPEQEGCISQQLTSQDPGLADPNPHTAWDCQVTYFSLDHLGDRCSCPGYRNNESSSSICNCGHQASLHTSQMGFESIQISPFDHTWHQNTYNFTGTASNTVLNPAQSLHIKTVSDQSADSGYASNPPGGDMDFSATALHIRTESGVDKDKNSASSMAATESYIQKLQRTAISIAFSRR
jgi:hypothetical protein